MYKIEKIILSGYTRLKLGQVSYLEIDFNARDQIIIGTNGSGKSSIFQELSALPGDKNQFTRDGKKEIHIKKDGKHIIATNIFSAKPVHSFIVDGVEKNESGLVTIQEELAETYTGVTRELHDLLIGKIHFTSMKAEARRKWITRLSDTNINYLLEVYARCKEELSVISGGLKLAKRKLVAETSKSIKEEELNAIKSDVENLFQLIEYLTERRMPVEDDFEILKRDRDSMLRFMDQTSDSIGRLISYVSKTNCDISEIGQELEKVKSDIRVFKIREQEFFEEHKELSEIFEVLEKTKLESVAKLSTEITSLREEAKNVFSNKAFTTEIHYNPEEALKVIGSISEDLESIASNIESNPDKSVFSRIKYEALNNDIEKTQITINELKSKKENIAAIIEHDKEHSKEGTLTCPKCSHVWSRGLNEGEISNYQQTLKALSLEIEKQEEKLKLLLEDKERFKTYSEYLKSYRSIVSHTEILNVFWDKVAKDNHIDQTPRSIPTLLQSYKSDLQVDIVYLKKQNDIEEKIKLLALTSKNEDKDYDGVKKKIEDLNNKIHQNNLSLTNSYARVDELTKINSAITSLENKRKELQELLTDLDGNTSAIYENQRREAFNAILRDLHSLLAGKERILVASINQMNLIKSLEDEIEDLTEKEKSTKLTLKLLSPTEGLIAKGLFGFMQKFIRNMNAVIGKVWSYPLVIKPCNCDTDGGVDLTYMFPMIVNGSEGSHKDVSEGSSAMLEVVDMAFRICALKALRMNDSPLFLDEFGKSMDPVHRRATTDLINKLMEEDSFSQMFLISHDISQYGALSNSDICILNDMNVIFPPNSVYNKHVVMY